MTNIGDIEAVSKDIIVVKRGFVNVRRYYIPIYQIEGWGDNVLRLKITEEQVKKSYERDNIIPDPRRYYIEGFPYYNTEYYPLPIRQSRIAKPKYDSYTITDQKDSQNGKYVCDLCNSKLVSETELSNHINQQH
jgi:hypothetical protein